MIRATSGYHSGIDSLTAFGDHELPDSNLTAFQRRSLKRLVQHQEVRLTEHELMYLAGAFEDAAQRKRGKQHRAS